MYYAVSLTFTNNTSSVAAQIDFDLVVGDHFIWDGVEYIVIKRTAQGNSSYPWVSGYALQLAPLVPPAPVSPAVVEKANP
jgi:hypothetical protein